MKVSFDSIPYELIHPSIHLLEIPQINSITPTPY